MAAYSWKAALTASEVGSPDGFSMRPTLTNRGRTKPRGAWWDYGESALTADGTVVAGDRLAFFTAVGPRGSRTFDPSIQVVSCWVALMSLAPD
jgi:hypothetical protein